MSESSPLRREVDSAVPAWAAGVCAGPVLLAGAVGLVGWSTGRPALASFVPGEVTMKPNTAVALLLLAPALAAFALRVDRGVRRVVDAAAALAVLIGAATLLEYASGRSLGIDQLLFHEPSGAVGTSSPGRMSGNVALGLILVGAAFLTLDRIGGRVRPARVLATGAGAIALAALIGHASGVGTLSGFAGETKMAIPSAVSLVALALGLLALPPARGAVPRLLSVGVGGRLLRRLLPLVIVVPVLLTALRHAGQEAGLYGARLGVWLLSAAVVAGIAGAVWWVAVWFDRSDAARAEAERLAAAYERRQRLLLDSLPGTAVVSVDSALRLTYASGPALSAAGYEPAEIVGRPLDRVVPADAVWELRPRLLAALEGEAQSFEFTSALTARTYHVEAVPLRDEGAMIVLQDVTERLLFEERARDAQREQGIALLAGGVAHDFNNLLLAILGNAELARRALPEASPVGRHLDAIASSAERAADLTRALLAYAGRGSRIDEAVSLTEIAREVVDLVRAIVPPQVELELELAELLPPVRGDATQLRQVVLNLIVNAAEAIGAAAGRITVRTLLVDGDRPFLTSLVGGEDLPEGLYACVEVADSGPGIDAETRSRIFDPFFTTKVTGHGLGLAAVQGIARAHRGGVRVSSEPGRGSTFGLALPVGSAAEEAEGTAPTEQWRTSGLVLVVDDDPGARDVAARLLAGLGLTVIAASGGREAVALVAAAPRELRAAIVDLRMPGMPGDELVRRLRQLRPQLPILMSSGFPEDSLPERLRADPMVQFIQKPYRQDTLAARLKALLSWYAAVVRGS